MLRMSGLTEKKKRKTTKFPAYRKDPSVGIIQIRYRVEAFASSQPFRLPFFGSYYRWINAYVKRGGVF